jgi:dienelactone hydrolase
VKERAVTFGPDSCLVGILSEPDKVSAELPAILLFNVGLNHHVGPHRLNVELARSLAERGYVALRFDLGGLGDSEPRRDTRSDEERAVLDVQDAMNFVQERKGIQEFVVVGLCSGVDPAHALATTDRRVRGAIFIDGYAYPTLEYSVREAADRVRRVLYAGNYRRWFRRRILSVFDRQALPNSSPEVIFDRTFPPRSRFKQDLATMLEHGVRALFLYTRQAYFFNHRGQFAKMIDATSIPPGVEVEHQLGADHVFTSTFERARGIRCMVDWIDRNFKTADAMSHDESAPPRTEHTIVGA